jgi:phospholipase D1/2
MTDQQHALESLHENIAVMRHPDHSGGTLLVSCMCARIADLSGELVYYFSHHEKLCVVDNKIAAMGGLDACYGRWDTRDHPLADVHPTEFFKSLFPGQGMT